MTRGFSETMSELRRKKGASQRTAAADLGISQALLSHYENGAREPGLDFVCRAGRRDSAAAARAGGGASRSCRARRERALIFF